MGLRDWLHAHELTIERIGAGLLLLFGVVTVLLAAAIVVSIFEGLASLQGGATMSVIARAMVLAFSCYIVFALVKTVATTNRLSVPVSALDPRGPPPRPILRIAPPRRTKADLTARAVPPAQPTNRNRFGNSDAQTVLL